MRKQVRKHTFSSLSKIHLHMLGANRRGKKMLRKEKRERRGVKSSIYPLDEKQTAIGVAQTCVSSPGIGRRLAAHQGPPFSFSVQMGERWKKRETDIYISLD